MTGNQLAPSQQGYQQLEVILKGKLPAPDAKLKEILLLKNMMLREIISLAKLPFEIPTGNCGSIRDSLAKCLQESQRPILFKPIGYTQGVSKRNRIV